MEGTLTDAGPIVAILNRNDDYHEQVVAAIDSIATPLLTTWPSIAEAMYLLGDFAGWKGQSALWTMMLREDIVVLPIHYGLFVRARTLMEKYSDLPMDLADATLVAVAEEHNLRRVFSLDHHFRLYRRRDKQHFEVVP